MLKTVKFPASISNLDTGLPDVDRNAFSHLDERSWEAREAGDRKREIRVDVCEDAFPIDSLICSKSNRGLYSKMGGVNSG